MGAKTASRKRRGRRGECSYCGKHHMGGPKGNSCGGHSIKAMSVEQKKPVAELDSDWDFEKRNRRPNMNKDAVRRRERAAIRQATYNKLSQDEKIAKATKAPGRSNRELARLGAIILEEM